MQQKYRIGNVIGGKACFIYEGIRKSDSKPIAIKKIPYGSMDQRQKLRLVEQINTLSQLESNHIVKYYQHFLNKKQLALYLIMQLCKDNLDIFLQQLLQQNKKLSQDLIWEMFSQLVLAVSDMHKARVLHRNIKPSNVFGNFPYQVKIGDFGLLRKLSPEEHFSSTRLQQTYYLSPQQIKQGIFTAKTDIWALGCTLYQMVCLRKPFSGSNQFQVSKKIAEAKYEPVTNGYSKQLNRIIKNCLSVDPLQRPNASDLLYVPEISSRLKQKRNQQNIRVLKLRQQKMAEKQKQLDQLQQQINMLLLKKQMKTSQFKNKSEEILTKNSEVKLLSLQSKNLQIFVFKQIQVNFI